MHPGQGAGGRGLGFGTEVPKHRHRCEPARGEYASRVLQVQPMEYALVLLGIEPLQSHQTAAFLLSQQPAHVRAAPDLLGGQPLAGQPMLGPFFRVSRLRRQQPPHELRVDLALRDHGEQLGGLDIGRWVDTSPRQVNVPNIEPGPDRLAEPHRRRVSNGSAEGIVHAIVPHAEVVVAYRGEVQAHARFQSKLP